MAINYVSIFFVTIFFGMECRSIVSPNLNRAVEGSEKYEASKTNFLPDIYVTTDVDDVTNVTNFNRKFGERMSKHFPEELRQLIAIESLTMEKLWSEFVANAVNETNQKDTSGQWLKLLKFILDDLANGIPIEKSRINKINDFGNTESNLHEGNKNFVFIRDNNWLQDLQEILGDQLIDSETSEGSESDDESRSMDSATLYSPIDRSSEEIENELLKQFDSAESDDVEIKFHNDISGNQKPFEKLCRKHRTAK